MKVAIIGAMDEEILYLKEKLSFLEENKIFSCIFYTGKINNIDIVLVKSGIGKVAAGGLISCLVNNFKDLDLVINVGVSGGMKGLTKTGDVIVSSNLLYIDADVTAFGYRYGQMASCPECFLGDSEIIKLLENKKFEFKKGTILTGDSFATNFSYVNEICEKHFKDYNVLAVDMESTAFAQMAHFYNKRYLAIRVISDVIGEVSQVAGYESSLDYASKKSNEFLLSLLKEMK